MLSPLEKSCLRWFAEGRHIEVVARLEAKTASEIELTTTIELETNCEDQWTYVICDTS